MQLQENLKDSKTHCLTNSMGIRKYDYIEFYVGSAKVWAYWYAKAFGMKITAYAGPETGVRDRCSYLLTLNDLKFVLTSALSPSTYDITSFITAHGDGVKRWAIEVNSVEESFFKALEHGAIPVRKPIDQEGSVEAAIRVYDDTEIVFTNRDNYKGKDKDEEKGLFKPGFGAPIQNINLNCAETGLVAVDHIVGNVNVNEMDKWANYFNKTLDFETFIDFGPGDISTPYSALLSKVVRSKDSIIKNPLNEPYKGLKKSQIEEFIEQYHGTGVQHLAIITKDIIKTVKSLRANGVEFLDVPSNYYEDLAKKDFGLTENINDLKEQGILCDVEGTGYLLQLFTKPIGDRPTFFFEIIQRRDGASGFGQGNFQSLFESIERDQARRGNL